MDKRIEVNGKMYEEVKTGGEELRIVCVDNRGLLFVGMVDLSGDSEMITIHNARCIIVWGTSKHIAELSSGPLGNTKLGAVANIEVFRANLQFSYRVSGDWGVS